ncbi:MAG: phage baseplate assembly protein V [Nitrospirota bacterium]|nr:phage baseplate assembly protein V [Nitrospirota bacterium]
MSIVDLLEERNKVQAKISGVMIGIVTNNQDPDKLGRVKVKFPRISGEDESNWARVISFMAGKERGAFFLPEVDDEVLVAFEYGDINMPYIIGSLWNGVDKPPETNTDGKNNKRVIKSRSGHIIRLNDEDGKEKIEIIDKSEKNLISIDTKENKITISSDKDIEISARNGKVKIEAKDIEIKSSASTKVEASAGMDLKASGNMTVKGATVNIN